MLTHHVSRSSLNQTNWPLGQKLLLVFMNDDVDRLRTGRFVASCGLLAIAFSGIWNASRELGVTPIAGIAALAAYLVAGGILIAVIVGRLFGQHELKRFRFDLTNAILVTTLIALPFAFANIQWNLFVQDLPDESKPDRSSALLIGSAVSAFLLLPTLFITEALLVWVAALRKRFR